jgi:L-amino acid N-acyltransferase YncA
VARNLLSAGPSLPSLRGVLRQRFRRVERLLFPRLGFVSEELVDGLIVRPAAVDDLPAIAGIYNYYVRHSTCTYQTEPDTAAERAAWFARHDAMHPVTVAEAGGEVVGWGSLSPFHSRCGYRHTVEDSVYVRHDRQRQGVGRALLANLIERAGALGHHTILALISGDQPGSIALHRGFGFTTVGCLREVGFKFDRWLDVVYMQRLL